MPPWILFISFRTSSSTFHLWKLSLGFTCLSIHPVLVFLTQVCEGSGLHLKILPMHFPATSQLTPLWFCPIFYHSSIIMVIKTSMWRNLLQPLTVSNVSQYSTLRVGYSLLPHALSSLSFYENALSPGFPSASLLTPSQNLLMASLLWAFRLLNTGVLGLLLSSLPSSLSTSSLGNLNHFNEDRNNNLCCSLLYTHPALNTVPDIQLVLNKQLSS